MTLANYLVQRGKRGTYQLRVPVPTAVRSAIGCRERIRSMGTSDRDIAARKAMPILTEWLDEFDRAAGNRPAVADVASLVVSRTYGPILEKLEASRRTVPDDDVAYSEHLEKREAELRKLTRWQQDGLHAQWEAFADRLIEKNNLPHAKGTDDYAKLVAEVADCTIDAYSVFNRRSAGEIDAEPRSRTVRRALELESNTAAAGETLMELFELWGAEKLAKGSKRADTVNQDRKVIEQFAAFVGTRRAIDSITALEVAEYRDTLRKLPPKWMSNKELRGLDIRAAAAKAREKQLPETAFTTVNKHLSTISPLYTWLLRQPRWAGLRNPTTGLFHDDVKGKNPRPPFSSAHLNEILKSPLFTGFQADGKEHLKGNRRADDWRYWIPLVCLFTGARLGEIAQLRIGDVNQQSGMWFIHIRHEPKEGLSTKSAKSRFAPVHGTLESIGFLAFHSDRLKAAGGALDTPLFPELAPNSRGQISGTPSRWWRDYLAEIGIKGGRDGFGAHSFRHTLADRLREEAQLLDNEVAVCLGHSMKTTTSRYGTIPQGTANMLKGYFDKVRFDAVDFGVLA